MGDLLQKPDLPDVKLPELLPVPHLTLGVDGEEYDVLAWAAASTNKLEGLTAEVGVREGGGSELIVKMGRLEGSYSTTHLAIDPYGNIPYADRDNRVVPGFGYDDQMRRNTQAGLAVLGRFLQADILFLPIEDSEFFSRFSKGVPLYRSGAKVLENRYRCVHIDGPHAYMPVADAAMFFGERMVQGGMLVFDNINYYDHGAIHREVLEPLGFQLLHVGEAKALHQRVGP